MAAGRGWRRGAGTGPRKATGVLTWYPPETETSATLGSQAFKRNAVSERHSKGKAASEVSPMRINCGAISTVGPTYTPFSPTAPSPAPGASTASNRIVRCQRTTRIRHVAVDHARRQRKKLFVWTHSFKDWRLLRRKRPLGKQSCQAQRRPNALPRCSITLHRNCISSCTQAEERWALPCSRDRLSCVVWVVGGHAVVIECSILATPPGNRMATPID